MKVRIINCKLEAGNGINEHLKCHRRIINSPVSFINVDGEEIKYNICGSLSPCPYKETIEHGVL